MGKNDPEEELRLILIGSARSGKSASGNTILGRQHFLSEHSGGSFTKVCQLGTSDYPVEVEEEGRRSRRKKVVVVEFPGFGDTHLTHKQIRRCVSLTLAGPHAFLLVIALGRYTADDYKAVTFLTEVFGEAAVRNHTVVLFTRGDDLERPIEQYLARAPKKLKDLLDRCGGGYHVFNNKAPSDVQQVHELLGKVEQVVEDDGGGCYTNAVYRVWKEEVRVKREEEDRVRKEEDWVKREEDWVKEEEDWEEEDRVRREEEEDGVRREEEDRVNREEEEDWLRKEEDRVKREEDRVKREEEDKVKREEDRVRRAEEDQVRREEDEVRRKEEDRVRREKDRVRREEEDRVRMEKDRVRREEEDRLKRKKDRVRWEVEDRIKRDEDRVRWEVEDRARRERDIGLGGRH